MDALLTIFWGLVVLIALVLIHELGHFLAARVFGVCVTEFMIGLPGPNIGFEAGGTRWGITCIPLGGYNRITGMEYGPEDPNLERVLAYVYRQGSTDAEHVALALDLDPDEAELALVILDGWGSINKPGRSNKTGKYAAPKTHDYALGEAREVVDPKALLDSERAKTYRGLTLGKRLVVLFAGPVFNILLALIVFIVIFCMVGIAQVTTTVSQVEEGSPAAVAGVQAGDTIIALGDVETADWASLSNAIANTEPGLKTTLTYERDAKPVTVEITMGDEDGMPHLGIYAGIETVRYSLPEALQLSWEYFALTLQAYINLFNPVTTAQTVSQSTSVVGISVLAKQMAEAGIVPLLFFIAYISLSLGIVNLVPMPPLDGGKIVVELVQRAIGRELPTKVVSAISVTVIALLLLLFVVLLRQDIVNFVISG